MPTEPPRCASCCKAASGSNAGSWLFLRWWVPVPDREGGPWPFCSPECLAQWAVTHQPLGSEPLKRGPKVDPRQGRLF
jgi:hypothetical protein